MRDDDDDGFYHSEEWQEERERVLELWNGQCEECGCYPESPHVHHAYGLGSSAYKVLCPDCHAEHHGKDEIAYYGRRKTKSKCKFYC